VKQLIECAFGHVDLDWQEYVHVDETLRRGKAQLHRLVGDPSKAREQLGWEPSLRFDELVALLVDADLERVRAELRGTRDREALPPG
jgi:GDPmannose 4,6-dehydratase